MNKFGDIALPLFADLEVFPDPPPRGGKMSAKRANRLIDTAEQIKAMPAIEAAALAFMARALVQATLPHSDPGDMRAWGRENGNYSLSIEPGYTIKGKQPVSIGLPYGVIPRLLLFWVTTEAVRTKQRTLSLGNSLNSFMRAVGLDPSTGGGPRSDAARLKEQMKRLFSARIAMTYDNAGAGEFNRAQFSIADRVQLWWNPAETNNDSLFNSSIELGDRFFTEITERPVPVDMRALDELKQSPLALDLYAWLTYRVSYMKNSQAIAWPLLQNQFGADFKDVRAFRYKVRTYLTRIKYLYPELEIEDDARGITLHPSPPHVPRLSATDL